jgi:hypothetical protein
MLQVGKLALAGGVFFNLAHGAMLSQATQGTQGT